VKQKPDHHKLLWEIIKLTSLGLGSPVVIDGWEILDFGVIVDYHREGSDFMGFCRIDWKDFPKGTDPEVFKKFINCKVQL
jgi:hypothetical protein